VRAGAGVLGRRDTLLQGSSIRGAVRTGRRAPGVGRPRYRVKRLGPDQGRVREGLVFGVGGTAWGVGVVAAGFGEGRFCGRGVVKLGYWESGVETSRRGYGLSGCMSNAVVRGYRIRSGAVYPGAVAVGSGDA